MLDNKVYNNDGDVEIDQSVGLINLAEAHRKSNFILHYRVYCKSDVAMQEITNSIERASEEITNFYPELSLIIDDKYLPNV